MQGLICYEAPPLPGIMPHKAQHYRMFGVSTVGVIGLCTGKPMLAVLATSKPSSPMEWLPVAGSLQHAWPPLQYCLAGPAWHESAWTAPSTLKHTPRGALTLL